MENAAFPTETRVSSSLALEKTMSAAPAIATNAAIQVFVLTDSPKSADTNGTVIVVDAAMNPARVAPTNATPVLCSAMVTKCQNASSHAAPHRNAAFWFPSDAARSSFPYVSPGRRFSSPRSAETRLRVASNASSRVVISNAPPPPLRALPRRRKHAASAQAACATNSAATREKRARLISLGVGALPRSLVSVSSIRMHG